ncbi:NADPH-dependent F420 reductase [Roseobacter weihaiensis]|uniref:NADPH-dependent F420 reductase n=1 Tax=Roseobacter weihaiensis TaxID=2763262 RepID=UPI001D0B46B2|nr:NAD(P)-binding domain-containing protein [Roseobacter sp. H9]
MKIGIVGSGNIGGPLGLLWAKAGHDIVFSSRNPETLTSLAAAAPKAQTATPGEAIAFGDVILEAIPFKAALELPADALAGKVLISASNYYPQRDGDIDFHGVGQSERLAAGLPGVRVVKAFNMMQAGEMAALAGDRGKPGLAIFVAGDDANARKIVSGLVSDARFSPVETGPLETGRHFESGAPLYNKKWTEAEARAALERI